MRVQLASLPGSAARRNEDWAGATLTAAVVLDGVSSPPEGTDHLGPWYYAFLE